mmetsp:Transcript_78466/g.244408  ORF Transcript_78466/g.244408 Transcript_78466/m.244408 type:complete len:401 (-) Transcript_78466:14-1216(-)
MWPRLGRVDKCHDERALDAALEGTYGLQAVVLRVQGDVLITEDREPPPCRLVGPERRVLDRADHEDLLAGIRHGDLLEPGDLVPLARAHGQRLVAACRRHLPAGDDERRQLPGLPLPADAHASLHPAVHGVVELQARLPGLVQPGHQHVVEAAQVVGPGQELRAEHVAAALVRPADPVVVLLRGGGEVGDEEHLVVRLLGPHAELQAADGQEAFGLSARQAGLVAELDGAAHLLVDHDEVRPGGAPLVVLLRVVQRRLPQAQALHGRDRHVLARVPGAGVAVAPGSPRAAAGEARAGDGTPHVGLPVHGEGPAPVDERVEVPVHGAVVGGPGEAQERRGGGEDLEEADAARRAVLRLLRALLEVQQGRLDLHHPSRPSPHPSVPTAATGGARAFGCASPP